MEFIRSYFENFYQVLCMMAPWLLLGFLLAGLISLLFSADKIKKHLSKPGWKSIFKASLFGVPLPLCSCSVIPVAAALHKSGAGKGATGAFFISTPQTGVDSLVVTWSILGLPMAIIRAFLAFFSGIVGGLLIDKFDGAPVVLETPKADCPHCKHHENSAEATVEQRPAGIFAKIKYVFQYGFGTMLGDITFSLLIGIAVAALIQQLVPHDVSAAYFGGNQIYEFAAMLILGIPLYVCSTASVPIAGALILKGISPGAVLVFLIVGPATNSATISAMLKILGGKSTMIYLLTVSIIAVAAGILLNVFSFSIAVSAVQRAEAHCLSWFSQASGILLLLLLVNSFIVNKIKTGKKNEVSDRA